jgi:transposase
VVQQTEYKWAYVFASVCPETGEKVELIAPTVNTHLMNAHLRHVSEHLGPARHAVLSMDGAGWHVSNDLVVPDNVTPLLLPPYSPELNPVERLWAWVRQHKLSNRVLPAEEALDEILGEVMLEIPPELIRSVCRCSWLERAA